MSSLRSLINVQVRLQIFFHIILEFAEDVGTGDKNVGVVGVETVLKP